MEPRVAWEQYDATDYENAADSFRYISCSAGDRAMYSYFEGLLWKRLGDYAMGKNALYRLVRRYPKAVVPGTELFWRPMAFAEYAAYAADVGAPKDIQRLIDRYGADAYAQDRVRWVESRRVPGGAPEDREFVVLPGEASVADVGTWQLARAWAVKGDTAKMEEILLPAMDTLSGTIRRNGKVLSIRREAQKLLLEHGDSFTRFMNGPGGVVAVLLLLEMAVFGPALYRRFWKERRSRRNS